MLVDTTTPELETWVRLHRGHAALLKELERALLREHGLTLNDYQALCVLARSAGGVRRTDLAQRLQLTASGITRLLERLERAGYVERENCELNARVAYAVLTEGGRAKLDTAGAVHDAAVQALLGRLYDEDELATLIELLGRLPGAEDVR